MGDIWIKSVSFHDLSWFIMSRGLWLTAFVLLSSLVMQLWPDGHWVLTWYAEYLFSMAAVLLGASLIGPLLLEDVLRRTT